MVQKIATDEAVDFARGLISELRERRLAALAGISTKIDPLVERNIAMDIGGEHLKDLAKRRHAADETVKRTRRQAEPRNSTTNFASARMYEKARRQDVELERAMQRAKQARAKFQLVYDAVLASEAYNRRLEEEMVKSNPAYARVAMFGSAISGVEALVDIWLARKENGETGVAIDFAALRDMAPYDAARRLMELAHGGGKASASQQTPPA